uniref:Proteasome subunit beta type 1 n=1 Tax=Eimeria tenella TaxID=5802 RepID=H9B921_EIMTE|nr:hypothetical protein [Eimeria tenella]
MLSCTDTPAAQQTALPLAEISSRHGRGGFNPYVNNGGTVVCVAGEDFVIGVGDTRLSVGYSIHSRHHSKITQLTSRCCIASSGMQADINTLHKLLKARVAVYRHLHRAEPSGPALSQLLSSLLYSRRFFPLLHFQPSLCPRRRRQRRGLWLRRDRLLRKIFFQRRRHWRASRDCTAGQSDCKKQSTERKAKTDEGRNTSFGEGRFGLCGRKRYFHRGYGGGGFDRQRGNSHGVCSP